MNARRLLILLCPILVVFFISACSVFTNRSAPSGRTIDPIVSTEWLNANLGMENLIVIDIRSSKDYAAGHIPGSISEPFQTKMDPCTGPGSNWVVGSEDCLWLQVPDTDDLFDTIGMLGITRDSKVVLVSAPNPGEPLFYGLANPTRVAVTLIYAGVANAAILDGGYPKWVSEGRTVTEEVPVLTPVTYRGSLDKSMFVTLGHVRESIGKAVILDARDAHVYSGKVVEPFADKPGHIPGSESLPTPWIWRHNPDGTYTYRKPEMLAKMASTAIGRFADPEGKEIIIYCGVGGYAGAWWFVMTQELGYENVRIYDGSAQEWSRHYDMVFD